MRNKINKILCFIFAISILISTIFYEKQNADALSVYNYINYDNSLTISILLNTQHTQFFTTDIPRIHSYTIKQDNSSYNYIKQWNNRLTLFLLCTALFVLYKSKIYTIFDILLLKMLFPMELIIDFIHKSDGKKRTYIPIITSIC